jgi:hypothetical protein
MPSSFDLDLAPAERGYLLTPGWGQPYHRTPTPAPTACSTQAARRASPWSRRGALERGAGALPRAADGDSRAALELSEAALDRVLELAQHAGDDELLEQAGLAALDTPTFGEQPGMLFDVEVGRRRAAIRAAIEGSTGRRAERTGACVGSASRRPPVWREPIGPTSMRVTDWVRSRRKPSAASASLPIRT